MSELIFPDEFMWGASTSSYQTEGGNRHADWYEWERQGKVPEMCGAAADSWNRYKDDVDLAASLSLNTYRISTEWSRVEPEPGRYDDAVIDRYAEWLCYARERGLRTMLVLWHFTNPSWLPEGAWADDSVIDRFEGYVSHMAKRLAPHVDWWATINEANTYANGGWLSGEWPPGNIKDYRNGFRVYDNLAVAHYRARNAIKEAVGDSARVGLTHVIPWMHPAENIGLLAGPCITYWNWLGYTRFVDQVVQDLDWLGVQYYHDSPCKPLGYDLDDGDPPRTDMGWRIAPEGLYHVLLEAWRRYKVPLIVTENGLADAEDRQRGRFILDHLSWVHRAISEGADVRGYLHWSLIDNFEWAFGYKPRFGLCEVDYTTFERRPRPSAKLFRRIARAGRIDSSMGEGLTYANGVRSLAAKGW